MSEQTLNYKLQLVGPVKGDTVRIPAEAKSIADKLLCEAQLAGITRIPMDHNEFVAIPGIHEVLLEYGLRRVHLPLASDMVVLGVAELMATNDSNYSSLLSGIVEASRVVTDRYDNRQV